MKYLLIFLMMVGSAFADEFHLKIGLGTGLNDGSTEANAWRTLNDAQTHLDGLGDNGSGDTVIVYAGTGASYGKYTETNLVRTDWLTYIAADGEEPLFNKLEVQVQSTTIKAMIIFDGFKVVNNLADNKHALHVRNSTHIKFRNLDVVGLGTPYVLGVSGTKYGCYVWETSTEVDIIGCTFSGGNNTGRFDGFGFGIHAEDSNYAVGSITNNVIKQISNYGIYTRANDILIASNDVSQMASDGILISGGTGGLVIEDNEVHDLATYIYELTETATATVWTNGGLTMTNDGSGVGEAATWGVDSPIVWDNDIELRVESGTNIISGDILNVANVGVTVNSPTSITLDTNPALLTITFTNGVTEPSRQQLFTGKLSGKTAKVWTVTLDTGAWDGSATGTMEVYFPSGAFTDNEALRWADADKMIMVDNLVQLTPENVEYGFRDTAHGDLLQFLRSSGIDGVIIRRNKFYDAPGQMLWIQLTAADNFLFENNYVWNDYTGDTPEEGGHNEYDAIVNFEHITGLTIRNNTIIGRLKIQNSCLNIDMHSNIAGVVEVGASCTFTDNAHNIFNRGSLSIHPLGDNSLFINEGNDWELWNDPEFTDIFTDYSTGDLTLSSGSTALEFGDPANSATTDILGVIRGSTPDAGAYQFEAGTVGSGIRGRYTDGYRTNYRSRYN